MTATTQDAPTLSGFFGRWITKQDLLDNPLLEKDIMGKFSRDYIYDSVYIQEKRNLFKELWNKYSNPDAYKSQTLKVHKMHADIKAFEANYRDADLAVLFSDDMSLTEDLAYMLEEAARFDAITMNKEMKDHQKLFNCLLYGASISVQTGYNSITKTPEYMEMHPDCWIPDRNGNCIDDNYAYHIFEQTTTIEQLEATNYRNQGDVYFNLDKITASSFVRDDSREYVRAARRQLNKLDDKYKNLRIVNYYCVLAGRKYLLTFCNMGSLLIRFERIEPTTEEEARYPELIEFPVVVTNIFPLQDDPFGLGYGEIILTGQNAINRLINAAIIKEQRAAGFQNYLVDITRVSNIDALSTKSETGPVFIPARSRDGKPIGGAVGPVQEEGASGNTIALVDKVSAVIESQTSMTNQNKGVNQGGADTLGQSAILQENSNVLFLLDYAFIAHGERNFWKKFWLKSQIKYLLKGEEKIYKLTRGFGAPTIKLSKIDFKNAYSPYVKVISRRAEAARNAKKVAYLMAKRDMLYSNPNTPPVVLSILDRELDRLNGISRAAIYMYNKLSVDESRALRYCVMINAGEKPQNLFVPGMDLFTYYIYISYCEDNDIKKEVILQLETMMIQEGLQQKMQQTQMAMQGMEDAGAEQAKQAQSMARGAQTTTSFIGSMQRDNKYPTLSDIRTE